MISDLLETSTSLSGTEDKIKPYSNPVLNKANVSTFESIHPQHWCGQHNLETESSTHFYEYTAKFKQKSAMSQIAEIARFNKIRHVYNLQDESGPAHKKLFTVKLILTADESFEGSGTSIKRAQQASAQLALQNTKLALPIEKLSRKKHSEDTKPDRILQNVCRSLHYTTPHYVVCNSPVLPVPECSISEHILVSMTTSSMYSSQLPSSMVESGRSLCAKHQMIVVNVNGKSIATGFGESYTMAKRDAASKALSMLLPILEEQQTRCCEQNKLHKEDIPKHKQKSIISNIHEKAHQLKMNVVFEVLKEEGPPHDRLYYVRCAFVTVNNTISAEATGKGKKKKIAQQEACSQLLKIVELMGSEDGHIELASNICRTQKKLAALNREPKRKTIVKDKKMDPLYGHQINPVSRLIQITQAKTQDYPSFELVSESGINKYKEFLIRVQCGEAICEGKGPNKRLAKRAAAEAMLDCKGYVKPLPVPGKSLLKKCVDVSTEISSKTPCSTSQSIEDFRQTNQKESEKEFSWFACEDKNDALMDNEKRRVTFNSEVHACPPPGDNNYPNSIVTVLKKDVIVEGKIRRMKRTKENRRALTSEQIGKVSNRAKMIILSMAGFESNSENLSAYYQLDQLSIDFKFSVQYTTFPEATPSQHFTIVSLGLEEPLVGHGTGQTTSEADENAAFAALQKLRNLSENS